MHRRKPLYVSGIIERFDNHVLIALPLQADELSRQWQFPRGLAAPDETPEAAMRRLAGSELGVGVEIVVGQPPLAVAIEGQTVELRYFICGLTHGEPACGPYKEIRWIPRLHLREYEFDDLSRDVAVWLADN